MQSRKYVRSGGRGPGLESWAQSPGDAATAWRRGLYHRFAVGTPGKWRRRDREAQWPPEEGARGGCWACRCCLCRVSSIAPRRLCTPQAYAEEHDLDYEKLLSAGEYKERYRKDMIHWGVEKRLADPGYFARKVVAGASKPILIISDARRASDMVYFDQYPRSDAKVIKVRVRASDETRAERGWRFTPGVDDIDSECGLDNYEAFDFFISNDGDGVALARDIRFLAALLTKYAQQRK
eukprot:scaffold8114_cov258-Pinguiococcus_pyrenoidosus.AAC.1